MSLAIAPGIFIAFLLALVRTTAWVAISPPFSSSLFPGRIKVAVSAALALAVVHIYPSQAAGYLPLTDSGFIGAVVLQAFTGLALGFITLILFSAVQAAGSFIDIFGGFSISAAYDPLQLAQNTVISRTFEIVAMMLLFASNGDLLLVHGFMLSFTAAPLSGISLHYLSTGFITEVSTFFLAALEIAGPLVAVLFLADVILGLMTKAAPQFNAFALGFPFKILVTFLAIGVSLPLLPGAVSTLVLDSIRDGSNLLGI